MYLDIPFDTDDGQLKLNVLKYLGGQKQDNCILLYGITYEVYHCKKEKSNLVRFFKNEMVMEIFNDFQLLFCQEVDFTNLFYHCTDFPVVLTMEI